MSKLRWVECAYCQQPVAYGYTWDRLWCDKECHAKDADKEQGEE